MLTRHDVTGLIASTIGGALLGYIVQMARVHWMDRPYHIVHNEYGKVRIIRNRR